ncbi:MAG: YchJ family protein [Marinobacter sp.]|uniref:YchJ family protein n=1 Tax=Marinobacter sp. TaxID=50741 RepID=UPI00299F3333|nr:YchJ family protein [Marinobacter sp.]MDX1634967.1 YchJ family protein [Marinobacter sp.]
MTPDPNTPCPCGSGQTYGQCCQRYHRGEPAPSPEALMRSRYCAFVAGDTDYLKSTWHPCTRPGNLSLEGSPPWAGLRIVASGQQGDEGQVHFQAFYRDAGRWGCLEENSRFRRSEGRWLYVDGDTRQGPYKPGRNEPCPCGSGRKFKACCAHRG